MFGRRRKLDDEETTYSSRGTEGTTIEGVVVKKCGACQGTHTFSVELVKGNIARSGVVFYKNHIEEHDIILTCPRTNKHIKARLRVFLAGEERLLLVNGTSASSSRISRRSLHEITGNSE